MPSTGASVGLLAYAQLGGSCEWCASGGVYESSGSGSSNHRGQEGGGSPALIVRGFGGAQRRCGRASPLCRRLGGQDFAVVARGVIQRVSTAPSGVVQLEGRDWAASLMVDALGCLWSLVRPRVPDRPGALELVDESGGLVQCAPAR